MTSVNLMNKVISLYPTYWVVRMRTKQVKKTKKKEDGLIKNINYFLKRFWFMAKIGIWLKNIYVREMQPIAELTPKNSS